MLMLLYYCIEWSGGRFYGHNISHTVVIIINWYMAYTHRLILVLLYLAVKRPIPLYSTRPDSEPIFQQYCIAGATENGEKIREFLFENPQIFQKHIHFNNMTREGRAEYKKNL